MATDADRRIVTTAGELRVYGDPAGVADGDRVTSTPVTQQRTARYRRKGQTMTTRGTADRQPGFGIELRRWRNRRKISLRSLAETLQFTYSHLARIERGERQPTLALVQRCDTELDADGSLIAAFATHNATPRPEQLPAAPCRFVGRDTQLTALDQVIDSRRAVAPTVIAIDGPAGVGKTALALRWAHRVSARFPHGTLYADLRGFAPTTHPPINPNTALAWFCAALGASTVPTDLEERAALYRSLLARRRVLIVLDNAADVSHVEHLMPGSASCTVVVTSRQVLSPLTVRYDALRLTLPPLSEHDSVALVRGLIGDERADAEPTAVTGLARLCGYLPLALRVGAERVAAHPHQSLTDLVTALSRDDHRLDGLRTDEHTAVRTVLSWSYRDLPPDAARMFRLLGLPRNPRISCAAAAALAGVTPEHVKRLLRRLAAVHLVGMDPADVVDLHDLLRDYARELATTDDDQDHRQAAMQRLTTWYLHTIHAASSRLAPYRTTRLDLIPTTAGVRPLAFADHRAALDWCDSEQRNFVAIIRSAAEYGPTSVTWQLALSLWDYLVLRRPWPTWVETHELAQLTARFERDVHGEAWVTTHLAEAMRRQHRFSDSQHLYDYALALHRRSGNPRGHAHALAGAAVLALECHMLDPALDYARRAHELFAAVGDPDGTITALLASAAAHLARGRPDTALVDLQRATRTATADNPHGCGRINAAVAEILRSQGNPTAALAALERATREFHHADDRTSQAHTRTHRGDLLHQLSRPHDAQAQWSTALTYYHSIRDQQTAADVRARFDGEPSHAPSSGTPAA